MIPCDSLAPDPLAGASARSQLDPYSAVLVKHDLRLGKAKLRIEKLKCRLKNHLFETPFRDRHRKRPDVRGADHSLRELYFERYRVVASVSARIRRRASFRLLPPKRSLHQDVKLEIPLVFLKIGSAAAVDREIGVASADLADECAGVVTGREEAFTCGLPITLGSVATVRAAVRIEANSSR